MSEELQPSKSTLHEEIKFNDSLSIQFHKLHSFNPEWDYALTPIFYKDGEEFYRVTPLWEDLQEDQSPESIVKILVRLFNQELAKLDNGGDEKLSWNEELLLLFRTRVIFLNGLVVFTE